MPVSLYMDVHAPRAIAQQLRRRGVEVMTAAEDRTTELADAVVLERLRAMARPIFTQDIRFKALAEKWHQEGRPFAGLIFGHQLHGTIGQYVRDLELIAKASDPAYWMN